MESRRLLKQFLLQLSIAVVCASGAPAQGVSTCPMAPDLRDSFVKPDCYGPEKSRTCIWTFQYRDNAAKAHFSELLTVYGTCPGFAGYVADAAVNHPDTSDAVMLRFDGYGLRVSLKDKSALGKTLVTWQKIPM